MLLTDRGLPSTGFIRLARYGLDDTTRDLLGEAIGERVHGSRLDSDADSGILASIGAHAMNRVLPGEILHGLRLFSATGCHGLILSNLPTQDFPPTPVTGFGAETELAIVNALHFGLLQLLGVTPFAVDYENDGRLIRNVVPNPAASGTKSSWGSDSEFFWHTDNPHLPFGDPGNDPRRFVPRYLTFYAVRNEERVPTELAAIEDVLGRVDGETQRRLQLAEFEVGAPDSTDVGPAGQRHALAGTAVLEMGEEGPRVRYDNGTTNGLTQDAVAALDAWEDALSQVPSRDFVMDSGEFLIFDNYRVLHRRRAFTPRPNAAARWLRRCYAS